MTAWFGGGGRRGLARLHGPPVAVLPSGGVTFGPGAPRDAQPARPIPDHLLGEVVAALIDAGAPPSEALDRVALELRRARDPRATAWAAADVLGVAVDGSVGLGIGMGVRIGVGIGVGIGLDGGGDRDVGVGAGAGAGSGAARFAATRRDDRDEHERFVARIAEAVALAGRSGLPPGDLIRDCARGARRERAERSARRLGRLPVVLVLPMGLCLLPAAVLLGVAPVVLGLLAQLG